MTHDLTGGNKGALEVGVQIGSTDPAVDDVNNDIFGASDGISDLLDRQLLGPIEYCCLHGLLL
ncbi:unannotated protein [freshwater metagenome]|uniref:Unannotated protein n=1 Tax=freshwater metagenome TaxID=449393 RepID=A0A6J7HRF1_9ZZZZ